MYENIFSTVEQCGYFLISGIIFGICYEFFRNLRIMFHHNAAAVFIEDLLFFSLCGFISFIISLMVGIGYFRIYYIVFELLGACIYFLTLGRLVNRLSKKLIRPIKRFFYAIYKKVKPKIIYLFVAFKHIINPLFVKIADFFHKALFNSKKDLPKPNDIVYNNRNTHSGEGEGNGVIKAQIRKKA